MRGMWKSMMLGLALAAPAAGARADDPRWATAGTPFAADTTSSARSS